jgi:hypothetical protein
MVAIVNVGCGQLRRALLESPAHIACPCVLQVSSLIRHSHPTAFCWFVTYILCPTFDSRIFTIPRCIDEISYDPQDLSFTRCTFVHVTDGIDEDFDCEPSLAEINQDLAPLLRRWRLPTLRRSQHDELSGVLTCAPHAAWRTVRISPSRCDIWIASHNDVFEPIPTRTMVKNWVSTVGEPFQAEDIDRFPIVRRFSS